MDKQTLRKIYQNKRLSLSFTEVESRSQALAKRFFKELPFQEWKNLHIFLPINTQKEINTFYIAHFLQKNFPKLQLIISKTNFKEKKMSHFIWEKNTQLKRNHYQIPEPQDGQPFDNQVLDAVIIPLLIFDTKGFRVGYGGGFYDRFLASCPEKTLKIGISFFEPVPEITDINQYDISLDLCLTNKQIWTFER